MPRFRDRTEVSCVIKYLVFGFNIIFWLFGGAICAIGLWALAEKNTFGNISRLANLPVDPAFFFLVAGALIFIIGFAGCIGALRENTVWLLVYCVLIGIILCAEIVFFILVFVYKEWMKGEVRNELLNLIRNYRDDIDLQGLIDWVQADWLSCCGVDGPTDWDQNIYFNCSSPGVEACGVPYSCCVKSNTGLVNYQCGYGARNIKLSDDSSSGQQSQVSQIYQVGCLSAGEQWINSNIIPVAGVSIGLAVLEILGICFAQNLRTDIFSQKSKWETVQRNRHLS